MYWMVRQVIIEHNAKQCIIIEIYHLYGRSVLFMLVCISIDRNMITINISQMIKGIPICFIDNALPDRVYLFMYTILCLSRLYTIMEKKNTVSY